MQLTINGEQKSFEHVDTLEELLTLLNIQRRFLAVELNESIVSREDYATTTLTAGDRIEIVTLVGGG